MKEAEIEVMKKEVKPPACMGGFCLKRDTCPHYLATDRRHVEERLCMSDEPIQRRRAPGTWERKHITHMARAQPFDALMA